MAYQIPDGYEGYEDMLADADDAPERPKQFRPMPVEGVGELSVCRPSPASTALLAMWMNATVDDQTRSRYRTLFVRAHLADGEFDRLLERMVDDDTAGDVVGRVGEAICVWRTPRTHRAVVSLAVNAAHHWRTCRTKLALSGITDPMALPSMHALLDVVESMVLESMVGGGSAGEDELRRDRFLRDLYPPVVAVRAGKVVPPPGFESSEAIEGAFDAFARRMAGR